MPMRGNSEVCHTIKNTAEFLQTLPIIKTYQPTFIAKKNIVIPNPLCFFLCYFV